MADSANDLWAEAAIKEIQLRYCRGVDRLEWSMVRGCFHPDAELDYGHYQGDIDGFLAMAEPGLATYSSTTHFIGNQLVELDGNDAWAEHYVVAWHRCPQADGVPEHDFVCNFRYVDRLQWRADANESGVWKIARRVLLVDSWRRTPLPDLGPGPTITPGARDKSDPSWSDKFRVKL